MSMTDESCWARVLVKRCLFLIPFAVAVDVFASAQSASVGQVLFDRYGCYQCHGHAGQGGAAVRIAPTMYPLQAFAQFVRRPSNEMPAYSRRALSDAQLRSIYEYIRAVPEPKSALDLGILR